MRISRKPFVGANLTEQHVEKLATLCRATRRNRSEVIRLLIESAEPPKRNMRVSLSEEDHDARQT